jgi:hypothetical protein
MITEDKICINTFNIESKREFSQKVSTKQKPIKL